MAEQAAPWVLEWTVRRRAGTVRRPPAAVLFELADQITDRGYLKLAAHARPQVLRRLGALTLKAARIPGQRRTGPQGRQRPAPRQGRAQLRRGPASTAIAFAAGAVAGIFSGTLTSYIARDLWAAAAGLAVFLVIGVTATYLGESAAEPDPQPSTDELSR